MNKENANLSTKGNNDRLNKKSNKLDDKYSDWKDIANSYYDKALSLAVLLMLFSFMVFPNIDIKPYEAEIRVTEAIDIPPEIRERVEPPQELVRPVVDIVIDDDLVDDDEELDFVETIERTVLDYEERVPPPQREGETPRFVHYEDPPQAIRRVEPRYPDFARRAGVEGTVILQVEVFKDGSVGAIEVVQSLMSGPGGLDEAAKDAVRQWEFTPAQSGGQPVAVWVRIPIEFQLD